MKVKNFLFGLLLVPALAVGFNSCKDKDDDTDKDYAADIAGSYTGAVSSSGTPLTEGDVVINVVRTSDNNVNLTLKQVIVGIDLDIPSCPSKVELKDGKPSISGTTPPYPIPVDALKKLPDNLLPDALKGMLANIPESTLTIPIPITVSGTFASSQANLTISLSGWGLDYTGTKQ